MGAVKNHFHDEIALRAAADTVEGVGKENQGVAGQGASAAPTGLSPDGRAPTGLDGSATSIPLRVDLLPETRAFLRDWLDWVERGAPDGVPFHRDHGLCVAVHYVADDINWRTVTRDIAHAFDGNHPFGKDDYRRRAFGRTMHECPMRLAFARANASAPA